MEGHGGTIYALAMKDGYIVSGSKDTTIKVWSTTSLECLGTLEGHSDAVRALAVGDGWMVSGSFDKTIKVWDTTTW